MWAVLGPWWVLVVEEAIDMAAVRHEVVSLPLILHHRQLCILDASSNYSNNNKCSSAGSAVHRCTNSRHHPLHHRHSLHLVGFHPDSSSGVTLTATVMLPLLLVVVVILDILLLLPHSNSSSLSSRRRLCQWLHQFSNLRPLVLAAWVSVVTTTLVFMHSLHRMRDIMCRRPRLLLGKWRVGIVFGIWRYKECFGCSWSCGHGLLLESRIRSRMSSAIAHAGQM